jgi:hypothetical protein
MSRFVKNKLSFRYFLFDFFSGQKEVYIQFFEDLYFCDEINFEKSKKCPRNQWKGNLETAIPIKLHLKSWKEEISQKIYFFVFYCSFRGGAEIRSFQWCFVTKLTPLNRHLFVAK